ncbi:hypothetical protein AB0L41_48740 [Amycolatopsis mediterranei]|uniref:hypothetical protein n=1 Tax=Amycolatopsis mediterranei TaxID=33910 RepID=UPI00344A97ED
MSGEPGNEPTSPNTPTSPVPEVPIGPSRRELKVRIWLGLPLAVVGGYLCGDPAVRLQLAWGVLVVWWPLVLLALAVSNLLRSVLRLESLLAPGLLAFTAVVALSLRHDAATKALVDIALPAAVMLAGVALLLSTGSSLSKSWTRVLTTGRVVAHAGEPSDVRPAAILGELKVDLSTLVTPPQEMRVTAVFGHVDLTIPATWQLDLRAEGAVLTAIRGLTGTGLPAVTLRVLGFCGAVTVGRAAQETPTVTEK